MGKATRQRFQLQGAQNYFKNSQVYLRTGYMSNYSHAHFQIRDNNISAAH